MSDNIGTFLLANSGGQTSRGLLSAPEVASGHRGVPEPYATDETAGYASLEAFSRILEEQSQQDDSTSAGLKRAFQALTRAIDEFVGKAGEGSFPTSEIIQLGQQETGQTLPVVGNFLPEKALQQLQSLLDSSADTDYVLPDQARQHIQQLLDAAGKFNAADPVLPPATITTSDGSNGLSSVNELRARLATMTAAISTPAADTVIGATAGQTVEAANNNPTAVTTAIASAKDAAISARLGETMQQIAQILRTVMSGENAGKPIDALAMADTMKSSRAANLESRSGFSFESRQVPLSMLSQTHRPAPSFSAISNHGENIDSNLFLRAGLDQQSESVKRFNALQPTTDKIIEQMSARAQSLSSVQGNIQSAETRELPPMPWATANVSLKPGVDVQSIGARIDTGIQQSLQNPEWGRELGNRVVWMTKQQFQTANIKVNPPHLGPIEVRVVVQNDIANVSFISQHAAVRDVIESSVPRLREMLSDNGLNLGNVDVDDHSSAREHQRRADAENDSLSSFRNASAQLENEIELEGPGSNMNVSISQLGEGLIDYYV